MKNLLLVLAGFTAGLAVCYFVQYKPKNDTVPVRQGGYKFINPLLECDQMEANSEIRPFKSKISLVVEKYLKSGIAQHISVYFRDMNNGPWFGINEKEVFSPASLLKVPIMMTILRQAEVDATLLNKVIAATESSGYTDRQNIKPERSVSLESGYTLDQLVELMISQSDNAATALVFDQVDKQIYKSTFERLGVSVTKDWGTDLQISVKNYAAFFRILFNASYLNAEMSEKALEILTKTNFRAGIRSGVPESVPVAHKFGERMFTETGTIQLHDCGIVYYPDHPFLLCIMTRGESLSSQAEAISGISEEVYAEVRRQYTGGSD